MSRNALRRAVASVIAALLAVGCLGCAAGRARAERPRVPGSAAPMARVSRADRSAAARAGRSSLRGAQHDCPAGSLTEVVEWVNAARRKARVPTLRSDGRLAHAAHTRASTMAAKQRLSHAGWETVVRGSGARGSTLGENVAYNYPTAGAVMQSWMGSRDHRANILSRTFRRIGVGCVVDASGTRWWAQNFAD